MLSGSLKSRKALREVTWIEGRADLARLRALPPCMQDSGPDQLRHTQGQGPLGYGCQKGRLQPNMANSIALTFLSGAGRLAAFPECLSSHALWMPKPCKALLPL